MLNEAGRDIGPVSKGGEAMMSVGDENKGKEKQSVAQPETADERAKRQGMKLIMETGPGGQARVRLRGDLAKKVDQQKESEVGAQVEYDLQEIEFAASQVLVIQNNNLAVGPNTERSLHILQTSIDDLRKFATVGEEPDYLDAIAGYAGQLEGAIRNNYLDDANDFASLVKSHLADLRVTFKERGLEYSPSK